LSGRGLCDELITRPEESYRLCCVVVCDLETSRIGAPYTYNVKLLRVKRLCMISGFHRSVNAMFGVLGCYEVYIGIYVPKFRETYRSHLHFRWTASSFKMGPICCPEMSVISYQYTLRNIPEKRRSRDGNFMH